MKFPIDIVVVVVVVVLLAASGSCQMSSAPQSGLQCVNTIHVPGIPSRPVPKVCQPNQKCLRLELQMNYTLFPGAPHESKNSGTAVLTGCANQSLCDSTCMDAYNTTAASAAALFSAISSIAVKSCNFTCCALDMCAQQSLEVINANKSAYSTPTASTLMVASSTMSGTMSTATAVSASSATATSVSGATATSVSGATATSVSGATATSVSDATVTSASGATASTVSDATAGTATAATSATATNAVTGGSSTTSGSESVAANLSLLFCACAAAIAYFKN